MCDNIKKFLSALNIQKVDYSLIKTALSHPSYTKEQEIDKLYSYERLEFLGDSVLKLASSSYLYNKYPNYSEGLLTKIRSYLVSDDTLSEFAQKMHFPDFVLLSKAEVNDGGQNKKMILACAFESVLGAIFLTYGYEFCEKYLEKIYAKKVDEIIKNISKLNPKANLQEYLQGKKMPLPEYKIVKEIGPAHDKTFVCELLINGKVVSSAMAGTKKEAQADAARKACILLEADSEQ